MRQLIVPFYQRNSWQSLLQWHGPALLSTVVLIVASYQYIPWAAGYWWLGLLTCLLWSGPARAAKSSVPWWPLAATGVAWLLPAATTLWLAGCSWLLWQWRWRLHPAALVAVLLMLPITNYASQVFSFPLRLKLTTAAAGLCQVLGMPVKAMGNSLVQGDQQFTVDEACMGLAMLQLSWLAALVILWLIQRQRSIQVNGMVWLVGLVLFAGLNVVANLFRILLLIWFPFPAGHWLHETMGLLCWLLYVVLPGSWLLHRFANWRARAHITIYRPKWPAAARGWWVPLLLLALVLVSRHAYRQVWQSTTLPLVPAGYQLANLPDGIIRLTNKKSLVYLKPVRGFYSSDHNPSICWRGSGYRFEQVQLRLMAGQTIYSGSLRREGATLHTAWWYQCGSEISINQWHWRWRQLQSGKQWQLVNVTAASATDLEEMLRQWIPKDDIIPTAAQPAPPAESAGHSRR
ncbi:MAG: exosortase N [Chitinophagaceae bacterium]|nr:exosortase N [Chitinophagaceae bacterium]